MDKMKLSDSMGTLKYLGGSFLQHLSMAAVSALVFYNSLKNVSCDDD